MPFNTAFLGGVGSFVTLLLVALFSRRIKSSIRLLLFMATFLVTVAAIVLFFIHDTPNYIIKTYFINPIPDSLRIHHAHWEPDPKDPAALIAFSASPTDLAMIIQSNELVLQENEHWEYHVSEYSEWAPPWWGPQHLTNPVLYERRYLYPDSTNITEYVLGLWVNDKTNEAMGSYIDF